MQITVIFENTEECRRFLLDPDYIRTKEGVTAQTAAPAAPAEPAPVNTAPAPAMPAPAPAMPAPAPAPAAKKVTRTDVQAKAIALMDAGKQTELQALLQKYGVPALPSVPEDKLAAFLADMEAI